MKLNRVCLYLFIVLFIAGCNQQPARIISTNNNPQNVYPMEEGFVEANRVMIYYKAIGHGDPLLIVHGGPGASHDYFLPYLLPLIKNNRLIFIDERGSGRSQKLEDPSGYTVENMVEDVEAVRQALGLGKDKYPRTFLWRSAGPGVCLKIPGKPDPPDPVQHFPQHC